MVNLSVHLTYFIGTLDTQKKQAKSSARPARQFAIPPLKVNFVPRREVPKVGKHGSVLMQKTNSHLLPMVCHKLI